jgi:hypothetical protein
MGEESGEAGEARSRPFAAAVKLIQGHQVLDGQPIEVLTRGGKASKIACPKPSRLQ